MTKKILFLLIFGFLLSTANTFACETKSNKCFCNIEKSSTSKKDCCKKTTQTNKENKSCNSKCGHSGCNIPVVQLVVILPHIIEINFNPFFQSTKKEIFYDFKTEISSGFKSIWLPPVIGKF